MVARVPRKLKRDKEKLEELRALLAIPEADVTVEDAIAIQNLTVDLSVHYKAGRKFPEATFTKLKKAMREVATAQGWLELGHQFYEADDIAASIVRANRLRSEPHNLILVTIDSDWLGLLDEHTKWFFMHGWFPRIRDTESSAFDSWSMRRLKRTFDEPRQLWDYKAKVGDKSDNLPSGTPLEVIDLLNPPEGHRSLQLWVYFYTFC